MVINTAFDRKYRGMLHARTTPVVAMAKNIPEAERQAGNLIKHDIALPISNIPVFLASCQQALQQALPTLSYIVFGHLGDGSLHFNVSDKKNLAPYEETINRIVYEWVEVYQGTIAAEHGIGQLKVLWLERYKIPSL